MARSIGSTFSTQLSSSQTRPFYAVEFLYSIPLRMWTGYGEFEILGNDYQGIGNLVSISQVNESADIKATGIRILLLENVGDPNSTEIPLAWKNNDGTGLIANANDIVEWDGSKWNVIFDSNNSQEVVYITNLNTQVQYRFLNGSWYKSVDGEYPVGTWRLDLDG